MSTQTGTDAGFAGVPSSDDVQAVTEEVWSTFLGHTDPLTPGQTPFAPEWSASVTIRGEWNGMVAMEMTRAGAHQMTCGMLGMDPETDETSDADVADAVGELVNMVGGNVKGLVPGPNQLSLPLVATGRFAHGTDEHEVVRLQFSWGPEPLTVTVHATSAPESRSKQ